jgi:hypothetical protein
MSIPECALPAESEFLHTGYSPIEEEFPMTMQVGMGTDGIVLASDTRWSNTEPGVRHTSNSPKIIVSHERGVAISRARSLETAGRIATDIITELNDNDWVSPEGRAREIAQRVLASCDEDRKVFECLIVSIGCGYFRTTANVPKMNRLC